MLRTELPGFSAWMNQHRCCDDEQGNISSSLGFVSGSGK
jgi:hypothetical protein